MAQDNSFCFQTSRHLAGVTVLKAEMHDFSYKRHAHEEIALGVTLAGRQDFRCRGRQHRSMPGTVLLLNPEDVHDGNPGTRAPLKYVILYIHPGEINALISSSPRPHKDEASFPRVSGPLLQDRHLRGHILRLCRLIADDRSLLLEKELHLYEIARWFARHTGVASSDGWAEKKDPLLLRVRDYIHDTLQDDISIDTLCNVACLSKYHFIRMFREQFGITPHQYIINHRINRVRTALQAGTDVSRVAQAYGFADVSHLNRHFKRMYGVTPRQYQKQTSE